MFAWVVYFGREITFGKNVIVVIAEEYTHGIVFVDVKENASAVDTANVFEA